MMNHLTPNIAKPSRVVVLGAGGFIGGAIARRLDADGIATLRLGRPDLDLLAEGASMQLARALRAGFSPLWSIVIICDNLATSRGWP